MHLYIHIYVGLQLICPFFLLSSTHIQRPYHGRSAEDSGESLPISRKNFRQALELADRSIKYAEFNENRAESLYIKGRYVGRGDRWMDPIGPDYWMYVCPLMYVYIHTQLVSFIN